MWGTVHHTIRQNLLGCASLTVIFPVQPFQSGVRKCLATPKVLSFPWNCCASLTRIFLLALRLQLLTSHQIVVNSLTWSWSVFGVVSSATSKNARRYQRNGWCLCCLGCVCSTRSVQHTQSSHPTVLKPATQPGLANATQASNTVIKWYFVIIYAFICVLFQPKGWDVWSRLASSACLLLSAALHSHPSVLSLPLVLPRPLHTTLFSLSVSRTMSKSNTQCKRNSDSRRECTPQRGASPHIPRPMQSMFKRKLFSSMFSFLFWVVFLAVWTKTAGIVCGGVKSVSKRRESAGGGRAEGKLDVRCRKLLRVFDCRINYRSLTAPELKFEPLHIFITKISLVSVCARQFTNLLSWQSWKPHNLWTDGVKDIRDCAGVNIC